MPLAALECARDAMLKTHPAQPSVLPARTVHVEGARARGGGRHSLAGRASGLWSAHGARCEGLWSARTAHDARGMKLDVVCMPPSDCAWTDTRAKSRRSPPHYLTLSSVLKGRNRFARGTPIRSQRQRGRTPPARTHRPPRVSQSSPFIQHNRRCGVRKAGAAIATWWRRRPCECCWEWREREAPRAFEPGQPFTADARPPSEALCCNAP